jgi:putative tryptophan/tyrosine transport system substrate-binding protein
MRRRQFITVLGGAMAAAQLGWPRLASAQLATDLPRVGFIYTGSRAAAASRVEAMVRGLREAGFESPTQVEIVIRYTDGDAALIAPMIEEVLTKNVNVFVANGPAVLQVARKLPGGVPVVAIDLESDPVASGVAASLAHPGGNVTGVFMDFPDFSTKLLELLLESNVRLSRLAVLWDPVTGQLQLETVKTAAGAKKIGVNTFKVQRAFDFESAFDAANQDHADAVIMLSSPLFASNVQILADLALKHRLPAITLFPDFARAGGLVAYGPNILDLFRVLGNISGKVLHGAKPADLPIERPAKFELVLNLRTAKALDLSISTGLLLRADEVIE